MADLLQVPLTVFWGLVMFSLIVFVHEGGHFAAARLFGLRVREFMLGLPGPNLGFKIGDTRFGVTPFLLGGYALIAGMQYEKESPTLAGSISLLAQAGSLDSAAVQGLNQQLSWDLEDDLDQLTDWGSIQRKALSQGQFRYEMNAQAGLAQGTARPLADPQAFIAAERRLTYLGAPFYKRALILLCGALFNLIFAIIVFTAALMLIGDVQYTTTVDSVVADSPAAAVQLQSGDQLVSVNGQNVASWQDFYTQIGNLQPGDNVTLTILRGNETRDLTVQLADNNGRAFLGVSPVVEPVAIGFWEALGRSLSFIGIVAVTILGLLNPATFASVISQSSSVVGVSVEAAHAAAAGFLPFITLAAALSISIGLMNLLPIPPLDGGKIVLEAIQKIIGRPIPMKIISTISVVALVLLGMLFLVVTWQDINRYILGG